MAKVALTEQQQEVYRLWKEYRRHDRTVWLIAQEMGLTTQRVYQHLDSLRALGVIR